MMGRKVLVATGLGAALLLAPFLIAAAEEISPGDEPALEPAPAEPARAPEVEIPGASDAATEGPTVPALLDLRTAQEIALANNPSLFAAAARVDQAAARVRQARSLYLPQVDAEFSAAHTHLSADTVREAKRQATITPLTSSLRASAPRALFDDNAGAQIAFSSFTGLISGLDARDRVDGEVESYRASITASFILFDGFSRRFTHAMARFGREETEAARLEAARLVLDAVAQSFHGVQLARENVAIARADEAFNERLLKEARVRKERGTGSKSDVLNFEVALRAAQSARLQAEGQERVARVGLAGLMGLPEANLAPEVEIAPLPEESPADLQAPDVDGKIALALATRPDVQQGEFRLKRLGAQVGQRKSTYYPQVRTFASRDASETDDGRLDRDDFSSSVGVNVSYNLFSGGRNRAAVAEARYQREEAEYLLEELKLSAASDIRRSAIELKTAQENLVLQRTTAEYVNTNRDLVEKEYEAGQGSLVRLNQAQRDLVEAEARLALARVALYAAWHALNTATGETISAFEGYTPETLGAE